MGTAWIALVAAAFAGGFLNQIFNALLGDRLAAEREFRRWKRIEKFRVYAELMDLLASSSPECGYEKWPGKIRSLSQKVYLLHKQGRPPEPLCDCLEGAFQMTVHARRGELVDAKLRSELKRIGSELRRELAISLGKHE